MGSTISKRNPLKKNHYPINSYEPNPISLCPENLGEFPSDRLCDSCMERPIQTRLNCGHESLCYMCMYTWVQVYKKSTCPVCRTEIEKIQVPYLLEYTFLKNN